VPDITVGLRVPHDLPGGAAGLRDFVARAEATGIDRLFTGDHVMFSGGRGFDGLLTATAVAMTSRRLVVQTAVYLLALRHPVPVARQVASLAALAPGRLVFGVGLGGEDPAELKAREVGRGHRHPFPLDLPGQGDPGSLGQFSAMIAANCAATQSESAHRATHVTH